MATTCNAQMNFTTLCMDIQLILKITKYYITMATKPYRPTGFSYIMAERLGVKQVILQCMSISAGICINTLSIKCFYVCVCVCVTKVGSPGGRTVVRHDLRT